MVLSDIPPKLRELIRDLESAGFQISGGKGSYRNFRHASAVVVSGKSGGNARPYRIRDVKWTISKVSDEKE